MFLLNGKIKFKVEIGGISLKESDGGKIYERQLSVIVEGRLVAAYPCSVFPDARYPNWDKSCVQPASMRRKELWQRVAPGLYYAIAWKHTNPDDSQYPGFCVVADLKGLDHQDPRKSPGRTLKMCSLGTPRGSSVTPTHTDRGINIHKGGNAGTTAVGCITIWPGCYENFLSTSYYPGDIIELEVKG